ncbi:MAG: MFS transporter [Simkaniaceae bacterium]|nr:MFS transporter [Simkaniaceae bacterium]
MKRIFPLYLITFIAFCGFAMIIPIFSTLIIDGNSALFPKHLDLGQRTFLFGLLMMTYPLGQFFGSPILGALSDRYGRKPILLYSLTITMLCYFVIGLCIELTNPRLLFLILFIAGFFEGNIAIAQSSISDISPAELKPARFGYTFSVASISFIVGPFYGGRVAELISIPAPFYIVGLLLFLLLIYLFFGFEETHPPENRKQVHFLQALTNIRHVFSDRKLRRSYIISFFAAMVFFGFLRTYPSYLVAHFNLDISEVSDMMAYSNIPMVLTMLFLLKPLIRRYSIKMVGAIAALLLAPSILIFLYFHSFDAMFVTIIPLMFFLAFSGPVTTALVSERAGEHQGRAIGNYVSLMVLGQALASLILNALAGISFYVPFLIVVAFTLLNALLIYLLPAPAEG